MNFPEVALRRMARILNGGTPTPDEENWGDGVAWATPVDLGKSNGQVIASTSRSITARGARSGSAIAPTNSVLLSTRAPIGYVSRTAAPMAFNQGCRAIIPSKQLVPEFLLYAIVHSTEELQALGQGSTFQEISGSTLSGMKIPVPSAAVQRQIADYLDAQTAKIDALIGKQERLIETLAERRQAVITETVENQASPTRGSLSSQLGLRMKSLYEVVDSRAGEQDLPLLSVSIHRGVQRRDETTSDDPRSDDLSVYKVCEVGDIVVNRMRAFQGAVGLAVERGLTSPDYLVIRPRDSVDARWLTTLMRSRWFVGEMTSRLRGIGSTDVGTVRTPRINASDLGEIRVRVPSLIDQRATAAHLDRETSRIDALSAKAREMIDVLKERRQALISAAVTGKIDVRGLA